MKKIINVVFFIFIYNNLFSQATFSSLGGDWSSSISWNLDSGFDADGVPDTDDEVIINNNSININVNASCKGITLYGNGILNFNLNTRTLSVTNDVTFNDNSSIAGVAASRILNINGNLIIGNNANVIVDGINLNVLGNSAINGNISLSSNTGIKTFAGNVNITATGSWTSTAITTASNLIFRNGITNNGSVFSASAATFNTNSQVLNGTSAFGFSGGIVISGATVALTNNGTVDFTSNGTGVLSGTGSWTQGLNSVLNTAASSFTIASLDAASNSNLVNYNRNNTQTIFPTVYHNLTISVANTKTLGGNTQVNNNLNVDAATIASGAFTLVVNGNTSVSGNGNISTTNLAGIFNLQSVSLTSSRIVGTANGIVSLTTLSTNGAGNSLGLGIINVSGISTIDGAITFSSNTGIKTFFGNVNITISGSWTSTAITTPSNLIFQNGITNNGTTFSASAATFNTNNQILDGSTAFGFSGGIVVTGGPVNLTNNGTVNLTSTGTGALSGTGAWIQGFNSVLNTTATSITIAGLDAASNANLVNYNRNNIQTVFPTTYHNLSISVANTKTLGGNTTVNNDLNVNIATIASAAFSLSVNGNTNVTGNGNISTTNVAGIFNLRNVSLTSSRIAGTANGIVNLTTLSTNSTGNSLGAGIINVSGNSTINGATTLSSNTGIKTFTGNVNITATGSWTSTAITTATNLIFQNGITNNGVTFSASRATFNTNNQNLSGSTNFVFNGGIVVNGAGVTLTNNSIVNLTSTGTGVLGGTGTWIQGINSILNTAASTFTISRLDAGTNVNMVNYNRNNTQTVFTPLNGQYQNLKISNANTKTLVANLTILGDLSIENTAILSTGFSNAASFNLDLKGNFTIASTATDAFIERIRTVTFSGNSLQSLTNSGTVTSSTFFNVTINNSNGVVFSGNSARNLVIQNAGTFTLSSGNLKTNSANLLVLNSGSILVGGTASSFVDGPIRKIGNIAFTFPLGKNGNFAPLSITAPAVSTDSYTAEYFDQNPDISFSILNREVSLNTVSQCEYWVLNRTNGVSQVSTTLNWNSNSCDITLISDMRVGVWNGTQWTNQGNSLTTGGAYAGSVKSGATLTTYGPMTLTSISIPQAQLIESQCGYVASSLNDILYSNIILGATQYEFTLENIGLPYNQSKISTTNQISLNEFTGLIYNNNYNVRVRAFVGGIWQNYGNPCDISIPYNVLTNLVPNQCNSNLSSMFEDIFANEILIAEQYRFRITDGIDTYYIDKPSRTFKLSQVVGIKYNTVYTIDVAIFVFASWQAYGSTCTVQTPPVGNTQITSTICGTTLGDISDLIYADEVYGATSYRFRVSNVNGVETIDAPSRVFKLTNLNNLSYGDANTIDVDVFVDGIWVGYGVTCVVNSPSIPVSTQITASTCGTTLTNINDLICADEISGATSYRFRVSNINGVQTIDAPSRVFRLTNLSNLAYGVANTIDVDVFLNSTWIGYGSSCVVNTPALIATTQVIAAQCGSNLSSIADLIFADEIVGASIYRFRVTNNMGTQTIDAPSRVFRLSNLSNIEYGALNTVDVNVFVNGAWTGYGSSCVLNSPSITPTNLSSSHCDVTLSSAGEIIFADERPGVTSYRFRFTNGPSETVDKPLRIFRITDVPNIAINTTYTVDVDILYDGNWIGYGNTCEITTPGSLSMILNNEITEIDLNKEDLSEQNTIATLEKISDFLVNAFPNPFVDEFNLRFKTGKNENIEIKVTDLSGKTIELIELNPLESNEIVCGQNYSPGMYHIQVSQGNESRFIRIIKN